MATRVLTNAFNADQGFIIDDRHIGLQCHIEMTRELVETWCRQQRRRAADALERQSADRRRPARRPSGPLAALNQVADSVYARWSQGLKR